jgi:hypothetical protein
MIFEKVKWRGPLRTSQIPSSISGQTSKCSSTARCNTLAAMLSALGRREEALAISEERKKLLATDPAT